MLDRLQPDELARVLRAMLANHPELHDEAEALAAELLSEVSPASVAAQVRQRIGWHGVDELNARSGDRGWGYVPPEEAADEILYEAIADILEDMKRKAAAGFVEAATALCEGIIAGLYQARVPKTGDVLEWSPDFPLDATIGVVADLRKACAPAVRDVAMARVASAAADLAPEWESAIGREADRR